MGTAEHYILSLSVHGLVRGRNIELGRDPDTGGQVSYVVDQARALAAKPQVGRVELATRQVHDRNVHDDYAEPHEDLAPGARIVRIPFGPRRYLRKESLWPHLDSMLDQLTGYVHETGKVPSLIHGHYADAGYVGAQLAKLLGVPFVFTGHSLGRIKKERLLADGRDPESLERTFHFTERIEAEERALETASVVIASTNQEVREQYETYDHYEPDRMRVIPPGVDLSRFGPPTGDEVLAEDGQLRRFLKDVDKPMVLAIARPDERKNFAGLVRAFAETPGLRERANLVLVAGNRTDLREMASGARKVIRQILELVDLYDLYGSVAYPKEHESDDIPHVYRLAAASGGVFVNPALTEPFGLTLIEAAASGLPVVATDDGGPNDIIATCRNGVLVDPLDTEAMGRAIQDALSDRERWERWASNGLETVGVTYSWSAHARQYLEAVTPLLERRTGGRRLGPRRRLHRVDRIVVTDVDDTLTGDDEALAALRDRLAGAGDNVGFAIATGRTLEQALEGLSHLDVPRPDVFITGSGTQLHYGPRRLTRDRSWERQIAYRWNPREVDRVLRSQPGLEPGPRDRQTRFRLSYLMDRDDAPDVRTLRRHLRQDGAPATLLLDHDVVLEVTPVRASPGLALRFLCLKWRLAPERLLVAGDSGNDADMLSGDPLGVVVGNHTAELEALRGQPRIHFAEGEHAWGVLEGIDHYDFFGEIRIPPEDTPEEAGDPPT